MGMMGNDLKIKNEKFKFWRALGKNSFHIIMKITYLNFWLILYYEKREKLNWTGNLLRSWDFYYYFIRDLFYCYFKNL